MTFSKREPNGFDVHQKIKEMYKNYGIMITGVPAEIIGQMQAQISLGTVETTGNIYQKIDDVVKKSEMTKPTNSCGQVSNEVCTLLLGIKGAEQFEKVEYEHLSANGDNLKKTLINEDLLVRIEVDRYNPPQKCCKMKKEEFNSITAEKNKIYLFETELFYLTENGKIIDLGQTPNQCKEFYEAITNQYSPDYSLYDPYLDENGDKEDVAIYSIREIFTKQKVEDCWKSTHSFTLFVPQASQDTPQSLYPYQAYWTKHTLQEWFEGDKDQHLSNEGIEAYIAKLALLGETNDIKIRSNIYGVLFSPPGKEKTFCTHMNEKTQPLRVKYKITTVDPQLALENLEEIQQFIDKNYPGDNVEKQCDNYKEKAQKAMAKALEEQLIKPTPSLEKEALSPIVGKQYAFFQPPLSQVDTMSSSVIRKYNLIFIAKNADSFTGKERKQLIEFFKVLPPEDLLAIKHESDCAQQAWDEQFGLVIRKK